MDSKEADDEFWEYYASYHGLELRERDIAAYIQTYVPPFLLVIGTFGNIISAIILRKMYERVLSTCLYLFVIVIVDLIVLYILCGNVWLHHLTGIDVKMTAMLSSNSVCKIYPFIADIVLHLTMWMAVAMATETTLVTMRPPRLLRMCNLERARAVILLIIVLLVCINAHCFWTFALIKEEKAAIKLEVCTTTRQGNQNSEEFRKIVWPVMDILVADLLPYCIIFSCTVILITKRCKRRDQIRELETIWKSFSLDSDSAKQFHVSIITICVFHLILLLAKTAYNIFHFLTDAKGLNLVEYTVILDAKKQLADAICSLMLYIFVSCKFFMLLASSARFREEFVALMTCRGCCQNRAPNRQSAAVVKGPNQPLLLHATNNHTERKPTQLNQNQNHHPHPPESPDTKQQPPQTPISLCHPPPPQPSQPNSSVASSATDCNNLSPRKQIYSMTSV